MLSGIRVISIEFQEVIKALILLMTTLSLFLIDLFLFVLCFVIIIIIIIPGHICCF